MHYFLLVQMLVIALGPLVKMVLKMIGFGFVTYVGFNLIIGQAQEYLFAQMGTVGPVIQSMLGLMKFDVVVNIYFAAISTRFILAGIDKATDRKRNQVWHKPGGTSIDA
ncbi:DUF2523 domain-containing protein [Stutzerimonas nitrititolerans]|uniref:DUF2523 domain-containing protein n=1 Tax=Stutzerimonas nitrititolerans TaxID=2482751 RepID=UPI000F789B75|nr:DUF2523 domain-containing protein [Stutzerimonas nitrititolerans]RRV23294.1 DUF2523 domain-containing protein [Pseudomonas sp. s199]